MPSSIEIAGSGQLRIADSRSLKKAAEYRSATSTLANPSADLINAFSGSPANSGERVTVDKAMGLADVWAAVTLISQTIAGLPFKVYRTDENDDPVEARTHRAWRLIHDSPNDAQTADTFWGTVVIHLLLWGNAFIRTERGADGLVDELWLEQPGGMGVFIDSNTRQKVFRKGSGQRVQQWTSDQMLHIVGPSTDGMMGKSFIGVCRQELGIALSREKFEGSFYARGATMRGLVQHPMLIGETAAKNLRESLAAIYGGSGNVGQIGVLEEGATFQTVSMPLSDLEFVASKQLTATKVATMLHLPPAYLGGSSGDSLTYSTVESNKTHFATFAVAPWTSAIDKTISQSPAIFPQQNTFYAEHTLAGLLRADTKTRAEFYKTMSDIGAMSVPEIRKLENLSLRDMPEPPPEPPTNGNGHVPPELVANAQALADATRSP
jgi:HK97 family phage portal protein